MTSLARLAIVAATSLAAVAGAIFVLDSSSDEPNLEPQAAASSATASSAPSATVSATSTSPPTRTPTPTQTPVGPAPLTVDVAQSTAPAAGGDYAAAEVPVELSSVCEGAALDLVVATPIYASLQTTNPSLRYIDAALVVYETADVAARAYEKLAADVAACPLARTLTPTPVSTPGATPGVPIQVTGKHLAASIGAVPAIQWIQLQTVGSPVTQLRTAVTVTVVENVLLVVSVDEDSETATAEAVAAASLGHTEAVVTKLTAAAVSS